MKTTIEIPDPLFRKARAVAEKEGTTLRALVEEGLRNGLKGRMRPERFRLQDGSFNGRGLKPGVDLRDWAQIRALIYEGHGG